MKKTIITIGCIIATSLAFAGGTKTKVEDDGVLSNGFFLNIGYGTPSATITKYDGVKISPQSNFLPQNLGSQINIELGNQWYFHTTDNIGFGLKASWAQFGFSKYTYINQEAIKFTTSSSIDGYNFDLKLVKLAPMFTYAVNEDFAIDASFEIAPTVNYQQVQEEGYTNRNDKVGSIIYGVTFAPGVRVRYSLFALGYDYSFGTLSGSGTLPGAATDYKLSQKVANSRIYLGFQF